jgi:thiamine-phosphate pyrophosphorylase
VTAAFPDRPVICCVTDRARLAHPTAAGLLDHIRQVIDSGVDLVQIRERDLTDRELVDVVRASVDMTIGRTVRILVNDRIDIAMAGGASGVHLKEDSIAASRVRSLAPAGFLIGRSVHGAADAETAVAAGGCDYLLFGTTYPSASKPGHSGTGVDALQEVCRRVALPVLAIGGVDESRTAAIAATGAAGIAAIGAFVSDDVKALTARVRAMRQSLSEGPKTDDRRLN